MTNISDVSFYHKHAISSPVVSTVSGPGVLRSMLRKVAQRISDRHAYRILLRQNDYMLKDIGITRSELEGEAFKPFWQA